MTDAELHATMKDLAAGIAGTIVASTATMVQADGCV
jgi:hypothetical protein